MTILRRLQNAFALNHAVVGNEIKSSAPAQEIVQKTRRTVKEMFWVEKVKEKEHFWQNRMLILQDAGNLKQNFSSSAARGNRMEIITFLTIFPHDHCMGDSDDHLSTVGTEEQAQCHLKAPSSPHFYYSACLIQFPPSL